MRTSEHNKIGKVLLAAESRDPPESIHLSQDAPRHPTATCRQPSCPGSWLPSYRAAQGPLHLSVPKESNPKFCEINRTPEKSATLNQFKITYTVKRRASYLGLAAVGQSLLLYYFSFL